MFILNSKQKNVNSFKVTLDKLLIRDKSKKLIFEGKVFLEKVYDYFIFENFIICNLASESFIYNVLTQKKDILKGQYATETFESNTSKWLFSYDADIHSSKLNIYDLKTNNFRLLTSTYKFGQCLLDGDYFLCEEKKQTIFNIEISSIQTIWHFNLESLKETHLDQTHKYGEFQMKINHFIGVVQGILWIDIDVIMNGSFLLGLDAETGKCVHLLDTAENQNEVNYVALVPNRLPSSTFTTYDDKRNILFGFAHDHFHWQVDLSEKSPKIKMWSVEDEMKKHHAFVSAFMNCGISDSHVFFPVGSIGSTPQVFALNRDTLKVDWQYFLTEGGAYYTPTKVEVTETHLYVLDNTGTLHIFEKKEENEYSQA